MFVHLKVHYIDNTSFQLCTGKIKLFRIQVSPPSWSERRKVHL